LANYSQYAQGQWPSILVALAGLTESQLTNKHQPCPLCGGEDRYRFDDKDGQGTWFCNQCGGPTQTGGGGNGMDMLMRRNNWDFIEGIRRLEAHLNIRPRPPISKAESAWRYNDDFYICRFAGKKFVPVWFDGTDWKFTAPPAPRPLYNLESLSQRPDAPVLIVEGEKTADAAAKLFPSAVAITWPSGCKAINKADWSQLIGRNCTLWPDADAPGIQAMDKLSAKLKQLGAAQVRIVTPPPDVPEGWDLADAEWTIGEAGAYLKTNRSKPLAIAAEPAIQLVEIKPSERLSVTTEATPDTRQLFSKTDTEWLGTTIEFVFNMPTDKWICVDDILHKWIGTHYAPITDNELAPIVAGFLSQLYVIDPKNGEHCHPWKRPRYVDETFAWVRKLLTPVDINPANAINCNNGVLSWSWNGRIVDVKLEPHNYNHFFTYVTGYNFDENANPQHLSRLLEAVEPGDRDTMQRILGSGLDLAKYRATRGRPRAVLMIGEGANGKDTIRTALRDTLGARNFTSCTLADFRQYDTGRKFPIAPVRGSSVNWSSENSQFVSIDNLQSLKAAISGEELSYELKGVQESQFIPSALFVFNLNKDPSLTGEQIAIETRFHVFKFRKTFMATPLDPNHIQADPRLKDDPEFIREHICPAFLNWLLEGLKLSVEDGIDYATGRAAMEDVKRAGCHLWEFCDSVGLRYEPKSTVPVSSIYKRLTNWYKDEGYLDTNGKWLLDAPADRPVKAARLLVPALMRIFPKLASDRATSKSRDRLIIGLKLDEWADLRAQ